MRFHIKNPEKIDWTNFRVPENILQKVNYCKKITIHRAIYVGNGFAVEENMRQNNPKYQVRDSAGVYPIHIQWMFVLDVNRDGNVYRVDAIVHFPGYAGEDSRKYMRAQFAIGPDGFALHSMTPINIKESELPR